VAVATAVEVTSAMVGRGGMGSSRQVSRYDAAALPLFVADAASKGPIPPIRLLPGRRGSSGARSLDSRLCAVRVVTTSSVVGCLAYSGQPMRADLVVPMLLRRSAIVAALLLCVAAAAFADSDPGLVLGELPITKVVDGDTLRVAGLDDSLRLIGLDTEETFKRAADRRAAEADWPAFLRTQRGASLRPVKGPSPLGEEARRFAVGFFAGVDRVRLERDHADERRDSYGRHLAYALVRRDGRWVNYNVEAVRAGMSPYFTK
jgi:endonuclease YncB( thermonuclease family)